MPGCIRVEMTGHTSGTNMMDMLANQKEHRVSDCCRHRERPWTTAIGQTFRYDGEDCDAQKRSGCETDQRAKQLVRQMQRCANGSTNKCEKISRRDLPEWVG